MFSIVEEVAELHETLRLLREKFCYDISLDTCEEETKDFYKYLDYLERDFNNSVEFLKDHFFRENLCLRWEECNPTFTVFENCTQRKKGSWLRVNNPSCEK
jgi:hypothetical protein